ncbi:hypothetical protein BBI01_20830 [Chryseobacterium artocarpi]|uniref:Uncharacterized protein n=1 Tax=Chryseobacterium artocarpi TaxID=1414727 RepID=A0A1B8Z8L6_9FLAO|nr:hypothetical protein [Chryseobacterium artocarpi]OCA67936.1 hypothetical protein BBI01_20830 [Chryseobacterium artocarpi]
MNIKINVILLILLFFFSCKSKKLNYIEYYHEVYTIDSIHRVNKDTLATIKKYKRLFRKYSPVQNERIEEYENYIKYADRYNKNFGGHKSLDKLIAQVAPYWKYKREDAEFFKLYKKYGIDSMALEQKVNEWKKGLNKKLIDSFSVAFERDQYNERRGPAVEINDRKNADLLLWTFKNYGYPSKQKIGLTGNNSRFMPMGVLLNHMAGSQNYEYFKIKLLEYVRSGECTPRDYIEMVDKHQYINNSESIYGMFSHYSTADFNASDSARINRNRKAIGFPSLKKSSNITKDFQKKITR